MNPESDFLALWLPNLWNTCWQTGLFFLAVWAACRWITWLPAGTKHWLWWLVCAKLVLGVVWLAPIEVRVLPGSQGIAAPIRHPDAYNPSLRIPGVSLPWNPIKA